MDVKPSDLGVSVMLEDFDLGVYRLGPVGLWFAESGCSLLRGRWK